MRDAEDRGNMPSLTRKGRGAVTNPPVRFESQVISPFDDGWDTLAAEFGDLPKLATTLTRDASFMIRISIVTIGLSTVDMILGCVPDILALKSNGCWDIRTRRWRALPKHLH